MDMTRRFDILIHVQPWQTLLLQAEPLLDLAAGELGAAGICLSIKAPEPQDAIGLDPAGHLLAARVAPGALWQPRSEQYASTRLRPQASATLKGHPPVARLVSLCRDRSQVVRLRLSALRDGALASRHGDAVSCNALALPMGNHLCPSSPDVIELVRCELLELTEQFQPDVIELEHFTWPDRYQPTAGTTGAWPCPPGEVESALLALCFCPSCRQQAVLAGVEAAAALQSVKVHLTRWLHTEKPYSATMQDLLAEDEILADYIACQLRCLLAALQVWVRAAPNLSLLVAENGATAPWNPTFEQLAALAPRLTLQMAPDAPARTIEPSAAGAPLLEAAIDATSAAFPSGPDIVRCLGDLARGGIAAIELENGLSVSPNRLPFLRQAIRTARRERTL